MPLNRGEDMRVLIVDDHEAVRKGVRSLLVRSGYEVCGEGVDGEDALVKARELKPDVIVMDVSMPKLNGLEATRQVRAILPHAEVLILSQHETPEMLRQAFNSGARGYVAKSSIAKDLLAAIEKVARHEAFFDPAVSGVYDTPRNLDIQEALQRTATLEQALRESEELYRATFDQAAVGMCHVSLDGRFLRVNPKLCNLLGYAPEDLLTLTFMDITHPEDLGDDVENANALIAGVRESYQIEKRYIRKDGSPVWGQLTVGLLRDQRGNPRHFVSVIADIDDRKRADAALRESENRFRSLADTAPVLVWMADTDAQRTFFNKSWLEFTGRSHQEDAGMGWTEGIHREDLARVLQTYLPAVQARQPFTMEYRLRRNDGQYRWVLSNGVPRCSSQGAVEGYVGSCVDITPHKELEEALRSSEDQFRVMANSIPQLAWIADKNGSVFWFNQRWYDYTGTTLEQSQGYGWQDVHHPEHRERVAQRITLAWETGMAWEDNIPLRGKDGRYRMFLCRALPLNDHQHRVSKWFGTNTDVGEHGSFVGK